MHVLLLLTQCHFRGITLSLLLFPGLPRICARRELQSPSRNVTVDMFAENNSFPSGKPWSSSSAILEGCSPDASESICWRFPKQRSSSVAGEGTEQERGTGITRRPSFIYSHVSAEWERSGSSNNSRLVNYRDNLIKLWNVLKVKEKLRKFSHLLRLSSWSYMIFMHSIIVSSWRNAISLLPLAW